MLHVISHSKMAEVYSSVQSTGPSAHVSISPFSKSLKTISQQLTLDDFSTMKLILQSENVLKKQTLDNLKNPQELLRVLLGRSLLSQENTSLLSTHLKEIGRKDLARLLAADELSEDSVPDQCLPEENASQNSQMSIDDDDDEIMSSQNSISDEEKLMLKKVSE